MNKPYYLLLPLLIILTTLTPGCKGPDDAKVEAGADENAPDAHHDEAKLTPEAVKKYGIRVDPAKRQVIIPTFTAPARVSLNTDAMAHVGSLLAGRVVEIKVKRGDTVSKGDELVIIESPELGESQSDYLQKSMAVTLAAPAVELAKSAYDRAKHLLDESQGIALTEVQKREGELKAAQGALKSAESVRTAAKNKLHLLGMDQGAVEALARSSEIKPRYSIHAPIDGQVLEREVTLGELVSPDKKALLILGDMSTVWVIADVPEIRLQDVAVGASTDIRLVAASGTSRKGKISFIDTTLDPGTRSARVRIEVENRGGFIRPGMFAQVEISSVTPTQPEPVLVVPEEAVQTIEGTTAVFVPTPNEENTFTKRAVSLGKPVGGFMPVLSGLKENEPVVVSGSFILKAELGKGTAGDE